MELDPRTEAAVAGHILAHGEADFLDPAICLICNNHTFGEAAMVTSSCGHPFHPKCIEDALKLDKTKCPCGAAYPSGEKPVVVNPVHKRMMDMHKVQCPQGCEEVVAFLNLHGHVHNADGCPNTPYRCGNAGCEMVFMRKDKNAHESNCPHRLVPCELCERPFKHGDLQQHKAEQCPRRKIRCPHCEGEHLFCDKEKHMRGCTGGVTMQHIVQLKDMIAQQQQMPMNELLDQLRQQQREVTMLREKVDQQQQTMGQQQQTMDQQQQTMDQLQQTVVLQQQANAQLSDRVDQQMQTIERQQRELAAQRESPDPLQRLPLGAVAELLTIGDIFIAHRNDTQRALEHEFGNSLADLKRETQRIVVCAQHRAEQHHLKCAFFQGFEMISRPLIQQEREQSLAELRRLERQQEDPIWQRERAALPQRLTVRSAGSWNGEYSLRPERVNGAAVWGKDNYRLYRSREGYWGLTHTADGPQHNRGHFRLSSQPGSRAPLGGGWELNSHNDISRADGWAPRPDVSVTAP